MIHWYSDTHNIMCKIEGFLPVFTCVWWAVKPLWVSRFENPKSSEIHTTRKLLKVMIIFSEFVTWCACFGLCQWLWVLYFRMPPSSRKQNHHHNGDDSDTDDDDIKVILFKRCYLNYFKEEEVKMIKTDWDKFYSQSQRESCVKSIRWIDRISKIWS